MRSHGYCTPQCAADAVAGTVPPFPQHLKDSTGQRVLFNKRRDIRAKIRPFADSDVALLGMYSGKGVCALLWLVRESGPEACCP